MRPKKTVYPITVTISTETLTNLYRKLRRSPYVFLDDVFLKGTMFLPFPYSISRHNYRDS